MGGKFPRLSLRYPTFTLVGQPEENASRVDAFYLLLGAFWWPCCSSPLRATGAVRRAAAALAAFHRCVTLTLIRPLRVAARSEESGLAGLGGGIRVSWSAWPDDA